MRVEDKPAYKVFAVILSVAVLCALCWSVYTIHPDEAPRPYVHVTLYDTEGDELKSWSGTLDRSLDEDNRTGVILDGKVYYAHGGILVVEEVEKG